MGIGNTKRIFDKGESVIITTGEWDTYNVDGLYKVIKSINIDEVSTIYYTEHPEQKLSWMFDEYGVSDWLINKGYIEKVNHSVFHVCELKRL